MRWSDGFRRNNKRRNRKKARLTQALIALCALVFVFSAVKLVLYLRNSARTAAVNAELQELHEASIEASENRGEGRQTAADLPQDASDASTAFATQDALDTADENAVSVIQDAPDTANENTVPVAQEALDAADENTARPAQDLPDGEYQRIGSDVSGEAKNLYEINPDLVAWLNIPNVINLPVAYRDNSYYLTHDFYGAENDSGTLFLDVQHPLEKDTQYLFIHGHNMYDSSMFGTLTHYRKVDYIKAHPNLTLNTLYSHDTYEIIGSLFVSEQEMATVAGLGKPSFANDTQFEMLIETMRARAMHFTDEEIPPDTALLALSTCFEDGRVVVLFRRTATEALQ